MVKPMANSLPVLSVHSRDKVTTAHHESAEEQEWPYKYFHDQVFTKCAGRGG